MYLMSVCYGNLESGLISFYRSSSIKIRFKLILTMNESFMSQVGQMLNSIGSFL